MNKLLEIVQLVTERLPLIGILAFSLCSTWSVYNLLTTQSIHPTPLYWIPAILVELVTAGIIHQTVDALRKLTRSNQSKQDRRFNTVILALFLICCVPTVSLSVWANTKEFQHIVLGTVFPVSAVACAVWAALPQTEAAYQQEREREKREQEKARREREKARQEKEQKRQEQEREEQARREQLANLGKSAPVFELYAANPSATQADAAQALGITRQAVSYHLNRLQERGAIERNGQQIKILLEV